MGISDKCQAVIMTVSLFLVSLPTITAPGTFPEWAKYVILLAGLLGVAIKEGLGTNHVNTGSQG